MQTLTIDPEFQALIPPLSPFERKALSDAIAATGGPEVAIDVWVCGRKHVIVDGHNRYAIATELGLPYKTRALKFKDRAAVKSWMLEHQRARRNLSVDQQVAINARHTSHVEGVGTPRQRAMADDLVRSGKICDVIDGKLSLQMAHRDWCKANSSPAEPRIRASHYAGTAVESVCSPEEAKRRMAAAKVERKAMMGETSHEAIRDESQLNAARAEARQLRATIATLQGPRDIEETVFVWPDTHAPYHDPLAVAVALAAVRALQPEVLVILGDFWDFYSVSSYTKSPERIHGLAAELTAGQEVLDSVAALEVPTVIFLEGNHEHRLGRYIADKAPALHGMTKTVRDLLPPSWEFVPYGKLHQRGKMLYSHDFGRSGVNATRQGLIDVGGNIAYGHTHQLNMCTIGQQKGDAHVAMNCGWLGSLDAIDYKHSALAKRTYQHGFGLVRQDQDGNVWPVPVPIVGRSCVVDGRKISV